MMPWVSRLRLKPKLTGGYDWVIGRWYLVSKIENNVKVTDIIGNKITLTQRQAQNIFGKPIWVEQFTLESLAELDKIDEQDELKNILKGKYK
jgi:hypothetical protein